MTYKKALELLNDMEFADKYQGKEEYADMLILCKDALVKQIPAKPNHIAQSELDIFKYAICPVCRGETHSDMNFCDECGQKLKWDNIENGGMIK